MEGGLPEKYRVAIVGSGNWGCVAAKLIATNTLKHNIFHDEIRMWVYAETLPNGEKLVDVINQTNVNVKYLPVRGANMLVFVTPHQFVEDACKRLAGKLRGDTEAISLIKGMEVKVDVPSMISSLISKQLGVDCCVLMGANIADEIAEEKFSEATLGYRENREVAERWARLFATPYFAVTPVQDVEGVELCGTLKNIVALAAGFVDGLGMGSNTKAAIIRIGLNEMRAFSKRLFPSVQDDTFFESCGVADLIATCFGGRNRKVAEAFVINEGKRTFDELEAELLQGQKLQGVLTAKEVYGVLERNGWFDVFPLFTTIHDICVGNKSPSAIVRLYQL
ncbi:Glycerol-3-phosphate dehydrogenase [NAD(+)] [Bienertia sinuspersici]